MLLFVMLLNKNVYRTPLNESLNQLMQMNRVNSRDEFGHEDNTINRLLLLLLLFLTPVLNSRGMKKLR